MDRCSVILAYNLVILAIDYLVVSSLLVTGNIVLVGLAIAYSFVKMVRDKVPATFALLFSAPQIFYYVPVFVGPVLVFITSCLLPRDNSKY